MRAVIDTNVVVSAYLSAFGSPARVVDLLLNNQFTTLVDERILIEYRQVLYRPRFKITHEEAASFLEYLDHAAEFISTVPLKINLPDEGDRPFVEVAVSGKADVIVTGNLRHFPRQAIGKFGVRVSTHAEFLLNFGKSSHLH